MDPKPTGLEKLGEAHLTFIAQQSVEGIEQVLSLQHSLDETFPNGLSVHMVEDEKLNGRFPAVIANEVKSQQAYVLFDRDTFEELADEINVGRKVSEDDVARLYIGCGLGLKIIEERVDPHESLKLERLETVLTGVEGLSRQLKCAGFINEKERMDATLSVMTSTDQRMMHINVLRFGIGLLIQGEEERGNPDFGQRITEVFRDSLRATLGQNRTFYLMLMMALGNSVETAENMLVERISDLELAFSFPMSKSDIKTIIDIATWAKDGTLQPEELVFEERLANQNGLYLDGE